MFEVILQVSWWSYYELRSSKSGRCSYYRTFWRASGGKQVSKSLLRAADNAGIP